MKHFSAKYKAETLYIFQVINPNMTRIVNPKFQIDQIVKDHKLYKDSISKNDMNTIINIFNLIQKFKVRSISSFVIFPKLTLIEIELDQMNVINFKLFTSLIANYKLEILEDNTVEKNGVVTGKIRMKFNV